MSHNTKILSNRPVRPQEPDTSIKSHAPDSGVMRDRADKSGISGRGRKASGPFDFRMVESASIMGGSSLFWLIVAALFAYVWLLVKLAKPKAITEPTKTSKASLITQTVFAWPCSLFFGYKTLGMLAANSSLQHELLYPNPGNPPRSAPFVAGMWFGYFSIPLLFALSVRWIRSVMRKWKALKLPPVEEVSK